MKKLLIAFISIALGLSTLTFGMGTGPGGIPPAPGAPGQPEPEPEPVLEQDFQAKVAWVAQTDQEQTKVVQQRLAAIVAANNEVLQTTYRNAKQRNASAQELEDAITNRLIGFYKRAHSLDWSTHEGVLDTQARVSARSFISSQSCCVIL